MRVAACALGAEPGPLTPPLREPSGATAATKMFPVKSFKPDRRRRDRSRRHSLGSEGTSAAVMMGAAWKARMPVTHL